MQRSDVGVFISYSHEDRFTANLFAQRVRDLGYLPWIDFAGIRGGEEWKKSIDRAMMQSAAVLVLLTPEAVRSKWVQYEIKQALEAGHIIIPLLIKHCALPNYLEQLHYIDFRHNDDQGYKELQRALLQAVVRHSEATSDATESKPEFDRKELQRRLVAQAATDETAEAEALSLAASLKPLALVIEDMESTQELLRDVLLEQGLEVHIASTRNEAIAFIRKNTYDFITLDMSLGPGDIQGQEGYALLEFLKEYQVDVPIVMITSLDWNKRQSRDFFIEYGIKDMLDKPIVTRNLVTLVKRYVTGAKKAD